MATTLPESVERDALRTSSRTRTARLRLRAPHLFVLPYVIFLLAFGIGPGFVALLFSFAKFVEGKPQLFAAGLQNYTTAFSDFRFRPAMGNMLNYLAISLPLGVVLVVVLALMLHARQGRFTAVLRTIYFVPAAVAGPALVLLAMFMFDPTVSPFQTVLQGLGFHVVGDVVRKNNLPLVFTIVGFFGGAGTWIAIFFGALNGISREITEAAIIDGCNYSQLALRIKLPLIRPYVIYMLILTFAANVQLFAEPQLLSRVPGSTISKYWSPNQLGYAYAFELGNFGAAASISLLMLVIGLAGAFLVIRLTDFYRTDATAT